MQTLEQSTSEAPVLPPLAIAWGALLVAGQVAALQLIFAGTTLHYQHYRTWDQLAASGWLPLAVLAFQAVVVVWNVWRRRASIFAWLTGNLGAWRLLVLLGALIASSATLNRDLHAYVGELVLSSALQLIALANVFLLAFALPRASVDRAAALFDRLLGSRDTVGEGLDRFAWVCAGFATLVSALLCVAVYDRMPHVQDELKYLIHAQYLASGMLAMPAPPVPKAFELYLFEIGPHGWYSVVPPGWPAALAIGARLGAAWLVNPILTGINILLAYVVLRKLYDLRTARLATLLLALSPMHLFLGMSFMAHAVTLTCGLLGALGVDKARRTGLSRYAWLAGIAVGLCAIARQLDGLVLAGALGLWSIGLGGKRLRVSGIVGLVLGTVLGAAALLPYNRYFTGKGTAFPIMEYHVKLYGRDVNGYGFGPDRGMGWALDPNPGHSPLDATINANLNTTALNVELFGWAVGSLLFVYFFVLRGSLNRSDRGMLAVIALTFVAYFFNYFSGGPDFGARYWFLMLLPLAALTARAIAALGERLGEDATSGQARVLVGVAVLVFGALAVFMPWRSLDKYHHFLGLRPDVRELAARHDFGRSLVLVQGLERPDYSAAAFLNPLDVNTANAPVYAREADAETRRELLRAYADRPVWTIAGPTITGGAFRIVAGPVSASSLLGETHAP